jgi:hypothetical protein
VKTSGTARTVAARGSHAPPPLAAREIKPETGGPEMAFSPLLFLAGGDNAVTCKTTKRNKQVCFNLVFRSASLPFPFSNLVRSGSLDLLHCRSVSFGHPLLLLCSMCWSGKEEQTREWCCC